MSVLNINRKIKSMTENEMRKKTVGKVFIAETASGIEIYRFEVRNVEFGKNGVQFHSYNRHIALIEFDRAAEVAEKGISPRTKTTNVQYRIIPNIPNVRK